jgi:acyl-CoA synthetase (AMP-forming)/AMP-acid ligase II
MFSGINTLVDLLESRALETPDSKAYTFLPDGENTEIVDTYKSIAEKSKIIAGKFLEMGLKGQRAILIFSGDLDFISAFFGCLYAGVIAVPVYPPMKEADLNRLLSIMSDTETNLVLTSSETVNLLKRFISEDYLKFINYIETDKIASNYRDNWTNQNINPKDIAFLQYTSGSTGNPKGVIVSHGNIMSDEEMIKHSFRHSDKSVGVGWLPLYHDMGLIGNVLQPMYAGFHCVLMSPFIFLQKPLRWLKAISKYGATSSGGPNFGYELCIKKVKEEELLSLDLSSWNVAYSGSEPVKRDTIERFYNKFSACGFNKEAFLPVYGMAEATLFVSGGNPKGVYTWLDLDSNELENGKIVEINDKNSEVKTREIVSCGVTWQDQEIKIVNTETLQECANDEIGEIWLAGSNIANGYWKKETETKETFEATIEGSDKKYLRTGDLGFFRNNELYITGRQKDLIIIRGKNYYPQDIETVVEKTEFIRKGCSAAFSIDNGEEEKLYIVSELDNDDVNEEMIDKLGSSISQSILVEFMVNVDEVVFLKTKSIPKTSSGKVQRQLCKKSFMKDKLNKIASFKKKTLNK